MSDPPEEVRNVLSLFHPIVREWLENGFGGPTKAQLLGWPPIASGTPVLLCAPTGSGKTLTAFLWCLERLMFDLQPAAGCRRALRRSSSERGILRSEITGGYGMVHPGSAWTRREGSGEAISSKTWQRRNSPDQGRRSSTNIALETGEGTQVAILSSVDPANPFGVFFPSPDHPAARRPARATGMRVILVDGFLRAYVYRDVGQVLSFLPEEDPDRTHISRTLARTLGTLLMRSSRRTTLIEAIDGVEAVRHALASFLIEVGFRETAKGLQLRVA